MACAAVGEVGAGGGGEEQGLGPVVADEHRVGRARHRREWRQSELGDAARVPGDGFGDLGIGDRAGRRREDGRAPQLLAELAPCRHQFGDDPYGGVGRCRVGALERGRIEQRAARVDHDRRERPAPAEVDVDGEGAVVVAADVALELGIDLRVEHEAAEPEAGEHRRGVGADRRGDEPRRPLRERRRQGIGEDALARRAARARSRPGRRSPPRTTGRGTTAGRASTSSPSSERAQRGGERRVVGGEVAEQDGRQLHGDRPVDSRRQLGDLRQAVASVGDLRLGRRRSGIGRGGDDGHVHRRAATVDRQPLDERRGRGDGAAVDEQLDGERVQARPAQRERTRHPGRCGRRDLDRERRAGTEGDGERDTVDGRRQVPVDRLGELDPVVDRAVSDDPHGGDRRGSDGGRGRRCRRGRRRRRSRGDVAEDEELRRPGLLRGDGERLVLEDEADLGGLRGEARRPGGGDAERGDGRQDDPPHRPSRSSCITTSCSGRRRNPCAS